MKRIIIFAALALFLSTFYSCQQDTLQDIETTVQQTTTETAEIANEDGNENNASNRDGDCNLNPSCGYGTPYYCANFEYFDYGAITPQSYYWTKWASSHLDALVTSTTSYEGFRSLLSYFSSYSDRGTAVVHKLGDRTTGNWRHNFRMKVAHGKSANMNLQKFQNYPGSQTGFACNFLTNGVARLKFNGTNHYFYYPQDEWFRITMYMNLDQNRIYFYIFRNDGSYQYYYWPISWNVENTYGTKKIGGIAFWSHNTTSRFNVDVLCFEKLSSFNQNGSESESPEDLSLLTETTKEVSQADIDAAEQMDINILPAVQTEAIQEGN